VVGLLVLATLAILVDLLIHPRLWPGDLNAITGWKLFSTVSNLKPLKRFMRSELGAAPGQSLG